MTKEFWVNLPVKNIKKSKDFFSQLGFSFNPVPGNGNDSACLVAGSKNVAIMLFEEPTFKTFTLGEITDTKHGTEVLFSIDAESREEVDEFAVKVKKAGGTIYSPRVRKMAGCMVVVFLILTDIAGVCYTWI